jgi:hypothetical protein
MYSLLLFLIVIDDRFAFNGTPLVANFAIFTLNFKSVELLGIQLLPELEKL